MNPISDSQADESAYQDAQYYETMDGSLNDADGDYSTGDLEQRSPLREQDRFLPIANISKIMKRAIPSNGKVAKDAKECVQECVSEFISFITSEAAERCQNEKRKTINGEDLLWAMTSLGFENYVEPLKLFLVKLRDANKIDSSVINDSGAMTTSNMCAPHGQTVIVNPSILTSAHMGQLQHRTLQVQAAPGQLNGIGSATTLEMADVKPMSTGDDGNSTDLKSGALSGMTTITMASPGGGPGQTAILVPYSSGQVQSLISSGQVTIVNGNAVVTSATT